MKLIASMIVRNELHRYLETCVASLLEFCDEVRILDDGSTDGWQQALHGAWGADGRRVLAKLRGRSGDEPFLSHADARNALLRFTLDGWPTHILAIDADEFVTDGALVRRACETGAGSVWTLEMCEVWEASEDGLCIREDGGWRSHPVAMLWRPDRSRHRELAIRDQGDATGRTPDLPRNAAHTGAAALHFGWTRESERVERYERYVNGKHAAAHVASIMWPCERLSLYQRPWPPGLRDKVLPLTMR